MSLLNFVSNESLVVSTDLDGTLLDHHNYSWAAAQPALEKLQQAGVPIIINTSKTFEEVVALQKKMQINSAFVVENGSALFLPKEAHQAAPNLSVDFGDYWKILFGVPRTLIIEAIHALRKKYGWRFEGFSDWSRDQVVQYTGLKMEDADFALNRAFSEPIVWQDSPENYQLFRKEVLSLGYKILQGGRFVHVLGNTDKGVPLQWLSQYYQEVEGHKVKWLVLGDSQNDVAMLSLADYPVAVKSPSCNYPEFSGLGKTIFTEDYGPSGWNSAVHKVLHENNKLIK